MIFRPLDTDLRERFPSFSRYVEAERSQRLSEIVLTPEEHRSGYESGIADLAGELWRLRTARLTPRKPGAFVALWRRDADGSTAPFDADDPTAGLLLFVEEGTRRGAFRFTTEHLTELGVLRSGRSPGKRGFRVYPAWCEDLNPQARRTQRAQAPAFRRY